MNTVNKFFQIICNNRLESGRMCNHPLGDIQVDMPTTTRRYCRNCKTLMEYVSDGEGRITKEVLPENVRIPYCESIVVVEVKHGR